MSRCASGVEVLVLKSCCRIGREWEQSQRCRLITSKIEKHSSSFQPPPDPASRLRAVSLQQNRLTVRCRRVSIPTRSTHSGRRAGRRSPLTRTITQCEAGWWQRKHTITSRVLNKKLLTQNGSVRQTLDSLARSLARSFVSDYVPQ